ncbi:MAG: hypothetical protein HN348_10030 [Proteobacteria bacterium]|nr:hypothetical protein [Pseudomonadota bacterium]
MVAVVVFVGILTGCGMELPDPVVESIEPPSGYNGMDTVITIYGKNFYPQMDLGVRRTSGNVDKAYLVSLVGPDNETEHRLSGVSLESYTEIQALVPAEMSPGDYDLVVESPVGQRGTLVDAFTVTDSRAHRLSIDSSSVVYQVYETAWLEIRLLDFDGERVFSDFPVVLDATDDEGEPVEVSFVPGGLVDQSAGGDGASIEGSLGSAGAALVGLTVQSPQTVTLTATPVNTRSGVAEGVLKLLFETGTQLSLEIELPADPFTATAGVPFTAQLVLVDQWGFEVQNANQDVLLQNLCSSYVRALNIQDSTALELELRVATGTKSCTVDALVSATAPIGRSADIIVEPGPPDHFVVDVGPLELSAGEKVSVFVEVEDEFGNGTVWTGAKTTLLDDSTGLELDSYSCQLGPPIFCSAAVSVASEAMMLRVLGDDGTTGKSQAFVVLPGDPEVLEVEVAGNATAGAPFPVVLTVVDQWGNTIDASTIDDDEFAIADLLAEVSCTATGVDTSGAANFDCILTTATGSNRLAATYESIKGSSVEFAVLNGPLALVDVAPQSASVVAGEDLTIELAGFDFWGNAYSNGDKDVDLADSSASISVAAATLGQIGTAEVDVSFTFQGETVVSVLQNGVELGQSDPIVVEAAGAVSLVVSFEERWVWRKTPIQIQVEALDTYGNRADYDGDATVSSVTSSAGDITVLLTNGVGTGLMTWTDADSQESIEATTAEGLYGISDVFPVVSDCGDSGPTAAIEFGGYPEAIACLKGSGATIVGSMANSVSNGSSSIAAYAMAVEGGERTLRVGNSTLTLEIDEVGRHAITALAIGYYGCGDEVEATAWVGKNNGEPVGPLMLTPDDDSLTTGADSTTIVLSEGVDCSRDPAIGGTVFVRTDRGVFDNVVSTGEGLTVTLDSLGEAKFNIDATMAKSGGDATIEAWAESGAAYGLTSVELVGDNLKPIVWDQDPVGNTTDTIDSVLLSFSEPLLSSTIVSTNFDVLGAVVDAVYLEGDDDEVLVVLESAVDASTGVFTTIVDQKVRDAAGNRLDGTWSGTADDYEGVFGALVAIVEPVECEADVELFRPDGDDGAAEEADQVVLSLTSQNTPAWWRTSVMDEDGILLHRTYLPATLSSWTWNGRSVDEQVVPNGDYDLRVDPVDSQGNIGDSCTIQITVDNVELGG